MRLRQKLIAAAMPALAILAALLPLVEKERGEPG